MSTLLPSAAIVKAARQIDRAPSGKASNSFNAALIQETGRVFLVISRGYLKSHVNVVIYDNICQEAAGKHETQATFNARQNQLHLTLSDSVG